MTDLHVRAKKSLGQNFLKDPHYLKKIVDAANIGPADQVLEIGPGLGHLTRELAARAGRVLAIELDERLIERLRTDFAGASNVTIVHGDALEYPFETLEGRWKVVANLPYYISTPIIQRLIRFREKFTTLTLMLQKEVAERIAAPPGGKEYGYLSVLVQFYTAPRMEFTVPAGAFTPAPKVDSTVLTLRVRERPAAPVCDEDFLIVVVKAAFSQRRKTLRNALKQLGLSGEVMDRLHAAIGIDPGRRAETLSVEEFCRLADFSQGKAPEKTRK
jgi:16S rRNA (adenine1518-N6/adenine1519-N6)-dimethyltransferase